MHVYHKLSQGKIRTNVGETKNPATAGLVEPEAFHSFIPTVPRHLRCCDWRSGWESW